MIWTMEPTAKKLEDVETKVGNVGSTDLQSQVTTLNNKVGNVGSTDLQSQVNTLNSNIAVKTIYDANKVVIRQSGNTFVLSFTGATISAINTALNNISLPGISIRNVAWNYTDFKPCVVNINGTSATFIDAESWQTISDASKVIHGELAII